MLVRQDPDWYQSTSDEKDPSPSVPLGTSKSKPVGVGVGADGRKGGIGPVPYSCYYCSFNFSSLTNPPPVSRSPGRTPAQAGT